MSICFNPKIIAFYRTSEKVEKNMFLYNGETQKELEDFFLFGVVSENIAKNKSFHNIRHDYYKVCIVPCGQCYNCRKNKAKEWRNRIELENINQLKNGNTSFFITLTYDPEHCPESLQLKDCQDFMKRLRYYLKNECKCYYCGEYGDKFGRPHYHFILWAKSNLINMRELVSKAWSIGRIQVDLSSSAMIAYVAGYVSKKLNKQKTDEFIKMSKGLGKLTVEQEDKVIYNQGKIYLNKGNVSNLPRYDRMKLQASHPEFEQVRIDIYQDTANFFYNLYKKSNIDYIDFVKMKEREQSKRNREATLQKYKTGNF